MRLSFSFFLNLVRTVLHVLNPVISFDEAFRSVTHVIHHVKVWIYFMYNKPYFNLCNVCLCNSCTGDFTHQQLVGYSEIPQHSFHWRTDYMFNHVQCRCAHCSMYFVCVHCECLLAYYHVLWYPKWKTWKLSKSLLL